MKEKLEKKSGITLIALVVTIVILLILASISIGALTGDNGIIDEAHTAKEDTEIASWEEQIDLAIIDAENKHRTPTLDDVKEELKNKGIINDYSQVDKDGVITTNEPVYEILGKLDDYIPFGPGQIAEKNEIYTDENGDTATIPKGFEVSENETEQIIDEGLVISDEEGNEFVWIPVEDESKYVRNTSYEIKDASKKAYTDTEYLPDDLQPSIPNNIIDEKEIGKINEQKEKELVLNKNGFYISRYEAGKENSNILVSKKGANVWNGSSENMRETAKIISKTFINNDNVKSALCSGIQWDVIMSFVNGKLDGKGNVFDVTLGNENRHTVFNINLSGESEYDKVCNIYDLEGNCFEYVAEKTTYYADKYIHRGGADDEKNSASTRQSTSTSTINYYSFRFVLYVL